jgi:hypothetical protein
MNTYPKSSPCPLAASAGRRRHGVAAAGSRSAAAEPIRIAYLSPSFDISDAWERVYWSMRGRLDELGVEYEVQLLAVQDATRPCRPTGPG